MKKNLALLFNDADGCYDRIPPTLAELALRRHGCPKSITKAHTRAQREMKHHVRTSNGVSEGYIKYGKSTKKIIKHGTFANYGMIMKNVIKVCSLFISFE